MGIATLFRRFPARDDLVAAAFTDKIHAYFGAIDEALANLDPWEGFCATLNVSAGCRLTIAGSRTS